MYSWRAKQYRFPTGTKVQSGGQMLNDPTTYLIIQTEHHYPELRNQQWN